MVLAATEIHSRIDGSTKVPPPVARTIAVGLVSSSRLPRAHALGIPPHHDADNLSDADAGFAGNRFVEVDEIATQAHGELAAHRRLARSRETHQGDVEGRLESRDLGGRWHDAAAMTHALTRPPLRQRGIAHH